MNPAEHQHRFLRPYAVAALVGRPVKTIEFWYRDGKAAHVGRGEYGALRVCVCCCASLATTTSVRWVKRAQRGGVKRTRRVAA